MVRYFKKYDVRVGISTGQGFRIPFEEITDETGKLYEWGVLATQDGYVISELENLIRRQAGAVQEIGLPEFEALKKKEHLRLLPFWREIVDPRQIYKSLLAEAQALAAVVKSELPAVCKKGMVNEAQHLSRPMGQVMNYRPATVAR